MLLVTFPWAHALRLWSEGCATEQVQPCPSAFGQPGSLKAEQQFIFALKTAVKSSEQSAFGKGVAMLPLVWNCCAAHSTQPPCPAHQTHFSCPCWGAQTHRHTAGSSIVFTCCWMTLWPPNNPSCPWFKLLLKFKVLAGQEQNHCKSKNQIVAEN